MAQIPFGSKFSNQFDFVFFFVYIFSKTRKIELNLNKFKPLKMSSTTYTHNLLRNFALVNLINNNLIIIWLILCIKQKKNFLIEINLIWSTCIQYERWICIDSYNTSCRRDADVMQILYITCEIHVYSTRKSSLKFVQIRTMLYRI